MGALLLSEVIHHSLNIRDKPVFTLFLDARSAFDRTIRNHVFRPVVLSVLKGTNEVERIMKILSMNVKNCLKSPEIEGKLDLIMQKGFSFRYV